MEWGEYTYDKIFKNCTVKHKLSKRDLDSRGTVPVFSSESKNNGIIGYTSKDPDFIINDKNLSYIIFGDHTIELNIARTSFSVMDNVKVLAPNQKLTDRILNFIISTWKKCISNKGYSRHWKIAQNSKFYLPVKSDGKIDFDFMESFIKELVAERIKELEAERIKELEAYLKVTGLMNYELTKEEEEVLRKFWGGELVYGKFKVDELFKVSSYKKRFDANKVKLKDSGNPYVVRTNFNNGVRGYILEDEQFLNEGNTISFGQDTATVFYQERAYFTGDKIKIIKLKNNELNRKNALYLITSWKKTFGSFSWGTSTFSINKIEEQIIIIPTINNEPDFTTMEIFISAIQKLVIKDVVLYADRKLNATKNVINKI